RRVGPATGATSGKSGRGWPSGWTAFGTAMLVLGDREERTPCCGEREATIPVWRCLFLDPKNPGLRREEDHGRRPQTDSPAARPRDKRWSGGTFGAQGTERPEPGGLACRLGGVGGSNRARSEPGGGGPWYSTARSMGSGLGPLADGRSAWDTGR